MRSDPPAALPLIAYAAGLACGHSCAEAVGVAAIAVLLFGVRRVSAGLACLALAGGILAAAHQRATREANDAALSATPADRFVTVEAPLDGDWRARGDSHALRCRWREMPLTIYTRFDPPPIGMERTLVAEGFVRRNDRGEAIMTVKSLQLLAYKGERSRWHPATWNRRLVMRLRPFARDYPTEVALVEALALGRGERLDDAVRDSYKRGGTYHLLVFSGLQIAFAAGAIALLLRWMHAPRSSDWSLLVFAVLAPLFIGYYFKSLRNFSTPRTPKAAA